MNVHLVLPDLFWPHPQADSPYAGLELPALELVCGRGRRTAGSALAVEDWLAERYGLERQTDLPLAPYSLLGEGGDPGDAHWLRADPCHLRLGTDHLVLTDAATFTLAADEADALVAALNGHFAADGLEFRAPRPDRWYLRLAAAPDITTTPLAQARARSVDPLLPRGADARAWHARLNEIQMVLHAHPVNEAREARGAPPANSVWVWGAGRIAGALARPFARMRGAEPVALGLAKASGAAVLPPVDDARAWLGTAGRDGIEAIVLDALRVPAAYGDAPVWREAVTALELHWIAPLAEALRQGRVGMLTLHAVGAGGALQVEVTGQDLRYFWRRRRPLATWQAAAAAPA